MTRVVYFDHTFERDYFFSYRTADRMKGSVRKNKSNGDCAKEQQHYKNKEKFNGDVQEFSTFGNDWLKIMANGSLMTAITAKAYKKNT